MPNNGRERLKKAKWYKIIPQVQTTSQGMIAEMNKMKMLALIQKLSTFFTKIQPSCNQEWRQSLEWSTWKVETPQNRLELQYLLRAQRDVGWEGMWKVALEYVVIS